MSQNDLILLEQVLERLKSTAPVDLRDPEYFEYFCAEQMLKEYDLSSDEILSGITGGGSDGGIDGFYMFADENYVNLDFDSRSLPSGYNLEIYIFQCKTSKSFDESTWDKLIVSLSTLLNLSTEIDSKIYNSNIIEKLSQFREIFKITAQKFPKLLINIVSFTKGSTENINPRVIIKGEELKEKVESTVGGQNSCSINYKGARELLDYAAKEKSQTLKLNYDDCVSKRGHDSYVVLVPIYEYYKFLSDDSRKLRKYIFESNVRDFQGNTQVNMAIRESLANGTIGTNNSEELDFWWLNNGVTVLCTKALITGKTLTLKDPQIVNGLQTSVSVYEHFKLAQIEPEKNEDKRSLLVKVIVSSDSETRDRVIVATNSQTNLLPSAIKATDFLQRDIEQYFLAKGYFYDRRKNYYKNLGKPAKLIVSVPYLAQSILSIGFGEPDYARARPSSIIGKDDKYQKIFDKNFPMSGYLWIAKLQKQVDNYVRNTSNLKDDLKVNMRFHISMLVAQNIFKGKVVNPAQLASFFNDEEVDDSNFGELARKFSEALNEYITSYGDSSIDKIAKSPNFVDFLKNKEIWNF